MTIKELNKSKSPIVKIDKRLNSLSEKNLFPDKLVNANKVLEVVGLPDSNPPAKLPAKTQRRSPMRQNPA